MPDTTLLLSIVLAAGLLVNRALLRRGEARRQRRYLVSAAGFCFVLSTGARGYMAGVNLSCTLSRSD